MATSNLDAKNNPPNLPRGQENTTNACGITFTTATDPKNVNVQQSLGGSVTKVETKNDEGDVQVKIIKSDGSSLTMAEDGSIICTTAKREGDATTGRFDVASQGNARFKVGESLLIEVSNKNNTTGGDKGKEGKAFSLVVYGNIDITSHGGELSARAENINLTANNQLNLKAGSKIEISAGEGNGGKETAKTGNGDDSSEKEHGGVVEIKCGDFYNNALSVRSENSVDYKLIDGESAILAPEEKSNVGILSSGSFTLDVKGDMHEAIGGKKRTDIIASPDIDPTKTLFTEQEQAWLIQTGALRSKSTNPEAVTILSELGGLKFSTTKGDIDLYSDSGYWAIGNPETIVAGIQNSVPGYPNAKPGVYLASKSKQVKIYSQSNFVEIYANSIEKSGIKLSPAKVEIKNPTGIYLN